MEILSQRQSLLELFLLKAKHISRIYYKNTEIDKSDFLVFPGYS